MRSAFTLYFITIAVLYVLCRLRYSSLRRKHLFPIVFDSDEPNTLTIKLCVLQGVNCCDVVLLTSYMNMRRTSHIPAQHKPWILSAFVLHFEVYTLKWREPHFRKGLSFVITTYFLADPHLISVFTCCFFHELCPRTDWIIHRPCSAGVRLTGALSEAVSWRHDSAFTERAADLSY
jgi:hypothetical protein